MHSSAARTGRWGTDGYGACKEVVWRRRKEITALWSGCVGLTYRTLVQCYQFHATSFVATVDKGKAVGGAAEDA